MRQLCLPTLRPLPGYRVAVKQERAPAPARSASMKLRPLHNQLLIKQDAAEKTSKGGIILAESAQEKPHRGEVLAAGPGYHTDNGVFVQNSVGVGDVVLYAKHVGVEVELDGEKYIVVSEDAVIGVIEA